MNIYSDPSDGNNVEFVAFYLSSAKYFYRLGRPELHQTDDKYSKLLFSLARFERHQSRARNQTLKLKDERSEEPKPDYIA